MCSGRVKSYSYDISLSRKYVDKDSGHRMIDLSLSCTRNDNDPVVDAWMTLNFDL